jgi:hypothetical protein
MDFFQQFAGIDAPWKFLAPPLAFPARAFHQVADFEIESESIIGHLHRLKTAKGDPDSSCLPYHHRCLS